MIKLVNDYIKSYREKWEQDKKQKENEILKEQENLEQLRRNEKIKHLKNKWREEKKTTDGKQLNC